MCLYFYHYGNKAPCIFSVKYRGSILRRIIFVFVWFVHLNIEVIWGLVTSGGQQNHWKISGPIFQAASQPISYSTRHLMTKRFSIRYRCPINHHNSVRLRGVRGGLEFWRLTRKVCVCVGGWSGERIYQKVVTNFLCTRGEGTSVLELIVNVHQVGLNGIAHIVLFLLKR